MGSNRRAQERERAAAPGRPSSGRHMKGPKKKSPIVKKGVLVAGHKTTALKMRFGVRSRKSRRTAMSECQTSSPRSTKTVSTQICRRRSAYSCSTTIAPWLTRADPPKAPSKKATRCDPGGLSTRREASRAMRRRATCAACACMAACIASTIIVRQKL
jgi:hypothetical protein